MDTLSNIPQKVFNFFTKTAEELAKESKFKRRESPITPTAFINEFTRKTLILNGQMDCNTISVEGKLKIVYAVLASNKIRTLIINSEDDQIKKTLIQGLREYNFTLITISLINRFIVYLSNFKLNIII